MLLLGVSVAQCHPQLVARTAETTISSVGRVEGEARRTSSVTKASIAKATATSSRIESNMALLTAQIKAATSRAISALSECVKEMGVETEAKTSRAGGSMVQRLE